MITQKILEDYYECSKAVSAGRFDEYDKAVCDGYHQFYNYLQRSRDKQMCKLRYEMKYSCSMIAEKFRLRSEGAIRSRLSQLISAYNRGDKLPLCSTKDILYGYYYANRAQKEGCADIEDIQVIEQSNRFFRYLQSSRHKSMCEMRFISRRSYKYIAFKLGYCDEGTIRRKINRLIEDYDNANKNI